MYKAIVGSIGLYGAELLQKNKSNKYKIIVKQINYWSSCYRRSRADREKKKKFGNGHHPKEEKE